MTWRVSLLKANGPDFDRIQVPILGLKTHATPLSIDIVRSVVYMIYINFILPVISAR